MHSGVRHGIYRWIIPDPKIEECNTWSSTLSIPKPLAQCLLNRGFTDHVSAAAFLKPRLAHLTDPFLLPGMRECVDRLCLARSRKERLVIFGDYDVDGVTATAILAQFLTAFGWEIATYLPHRIDEGYGLSRDAIDKCVSKFNPSVLLAVDCGSSSHQIIHHLQSQNIDVLVLDHHQIGTPQPSPRAFVNPQLASNDATDTAGLKHLCSAGLAFKLAHALLKGGRDESWPGASEFDLKSFLDLVALGTIADMVPLRGENRIFVKFGLECLHRTQRPGIIALKRVAQTGEKVRAQDVAFQLAPRLNAAGRMETAQDALDLLLATNSETSELLAKNLDLRNRERQELEQKIVEEVLQCVRARFDADRDFCIVEGNLEWHIGVVGIVASRVLREFHRPVIILGGDGSESFRGSGRSIEGFNLARALGECSDLLLKHGGHAMAAGISILQNRLEEFRGKLNQLARQILTPDKLRPTLRLDAEIELDVLSFPVLKDLEQLEPTGLGNVAPQFACKNLCLHGPIKHLGTESQHLKFMVTDGVTRREAVWWNGPAGLCLDRSFDLAFAPELNEHNGSFGIQLRVLDLQLH